MPATSEKKLASSRAWKAANKARVQAYRKAYYSANKATEYANHTTWVAENPERWKELQTRDRERRDAAIRAQRAQPETKAARNAKNRQRYATDPAYRATKILRASFRQALRLQHVTKRTSVLHLIGCTPEELVQHIERQFLPGMSWAARNFHIDHIKPCAAFNLTDPEEQRRCFHYTNLQPLWPVENLRKGARPRSEDTANP